MFGIIGKGEGGGDGGEEKAHNELILSVYSLDWLKLLNYVRKQEQ